MVNVLFHAVGLSNTAAVHMYVMYVRILHSFGEAPQSKYQVYTHLKYWRAP